MHQNFLQKLFVFDIETIPDDQVVKALTGCDSDDLTDKREALRQYHLSITDGKNDFPRQPFHKVVAISFVEADIIKQEGYEYYELQTVRSGGTLESSEAELVAGIFKYLEHHKPRLVSFNGRTFDLPVLKYRAMVHGISAPVFYNAGDKWNSYQSRYSLDWHCDLLEALSDFGASARLRLNEACAAFGFPGKLATDGSAVMDLYDNGKLQAIRDYCETDVLNTWLVYLRYQLHYGKLNEEGYAKAIQQTQTFLAEAEQPHFKEFLDAWNDCNKKGDT